MNDPWDTKSASYTREMITLGTESNSEFHLEKVFRQRFKFVVVQGQVLHLVVVVLGNLQKAKRRIVQLEKLEKHVQSNSVLVHFTIT